MAEFIRFGYDVDVEVTFLDFLEKEIEDSLFGRVLPPPNSHPYSWTPARQIQ